jgi:hypothetical protein
MNHMKKVFAMLFLLVFASAAFAADNTTVRWRSIVGVITAQGVSNPVSAGIDSGTFAWTTRGGNASINLNSGALAFSVQGLVINGTSFSGTPGPVSAVTGTLVCNAGADNQATVDTRQVRLSAEGDAGFVGHISVPANCGNPLFLIRIAVPAGAAGRWIATGAERFTTTGGTTIP